MSNYSVKNKNSAKTDLKEIRQLNLKSQFEKVIQTLKEDLYLPTQSFEKLKSTHEGLYSRRLIRQHRVVYQVNEEEKIVEIYSTWTHYES